jgi:manganese transport protein
VKLMAVDVSRPNSLEEIHSSVPIPARGWRRFLAFSGPAFLVSVGYMDPGNWGTDIEAGSRFGYRLLWVLVMSNIMAILLQTLTARLGVVTGRDLAQACRENYPRWTGFVLWILCEIAIAACDLAEVIGTVIALKLLFGLPYLWGLLIAAGDTFFLLALQRRGVRLLEAVTLCLIAIIAGSFVYEIALARPAWGEVARGLLPGLDANFPAQSLYVAIGMLGATVMPHNLYLHSALVQTRSFPQTPAGKREACKYNLLDSLLALNGAFFVNAAILILSVCTFFQFHREVKTLQEAHELLSTAWGTAVAGGLFAIALLASGQSSTLTGTLAGQVVMEGFVRLRLRPWLRRLLTRSLAIIPALVVIALAGNETIWRGATRGSADPPAGLATSAATTTPTDAVVRADDTTAKGASETDVDGRLLNLLVLSQVLLSFQLPFAIVPLVHFTSDRRQMGEFASRGWLKALAWACAILVVVLNGALIYMQAQEWAEQITETGGRASWVYATLVPVALALAAFLAWVTIYPFRARGGESRRPAPAPVLPGVSYRQIGVAVELEGGDDAVLAQAAAVARAHNARLHVIHIVEGFGADFHGPEAADQESRIDRERISQLADYLRSDGLQVDGVLGYGKPADELVRIAREQELDLLVLGTHGHGFLADLALGQTVSPVLHRLTIPILVVPSRTPTPRGPA